MRSVLIGFLASILGIANVYAASPVVLELFTSQGCSSCPPADALLQKLSTDPSLLALSFHIDYWDQLGWRDPFSLAASTERQKMYERVLNQENIYTPELVIDGSHDVIGSRSGEIQSAIEAARIKEKPIAVTIIPSSDQKHLSVQLDGTPASTMGPLDIWLVTFNPRAVTAIRRITIRSGELIIDLNLGALWKQLTGLEWQEPSDATDRCITIPFVTNRVARGAVIIHPTTSDRDPLDLPSDQLKKLVQGHIWRNQHFSGQTIRDIARNEGYSDSYVGKCIVETFRLPT